MSLNNLLEFCLLIREQAFREEVKKRDTKLRSMRGSMAEQARQQQSLVTQLKMDIESGKASWIMQTLND